MASWQQPCGYSSTKAALNRTGRYVTNDPTGLFGGTNPYGYVNQNPSRFIDPMGLEAIVQGMGAASHGGPSTVAAGVNFGNVGISVNNNGKVSQDSNLFPEFGGFIQMCEEPRNQCDQFARFTGVIPEGMIGGSAGEVFGIPGLRFLTVVLYPDGTQCVLYALNLGPPVNFTMPITPQGDPMAAFFSGA